MSARRVVALAGGIGGARLVEGLAAVLPPGSLTIVVNTADDFEHLGLFVSPDVDTITYTLAGLSDRARGWGLADESFRTLAMVEKLGGPTWFGLGDQDLGTHLMRTFRRAKGDRLTTITLDHAKAHGIEHRILPMSDSPRATKIETHDGRTLDFQPWLVGERAAPRVREVRFEGSRLSTPEVRQALDDADLVVLAPSNPYVSIDPILTLDGIRERVAAKPTIGVSPIVSGKAVKGPLAAMLRDVAGVEPTAAAIAAHYGPLLRAFVVEAGDEVGLELPTLATRTVMSGRDDRIRLAREVVDFAARVFG